MFANRLTLFTLFGFRIMVDASWLLLAVLIVWSLSTGLFPVLLPGQSAGTYWSMGVIGLFGLAASIVAHELAHAVVARRYDMPIRSITLFIFGGVAEMEREPPTAKGEFLMAIAGPIMSLVVAFLFWAAAGFSGGGLSGAGSSETLTGQPGVSPIGLVLGYVAFINLLLAVFNMVPAFPLDGGRVLRSALWAWKGDLIWATRIAASAGSVFAAILMGLGLASFIGGNVIGGVWYFILGLFVHAAAQGQVRHQMTQSILSGQPVSRFMRRNIVAVPADLPVPQAIDDYFYRYFYKTFPVMDGGSLVGVLGTEQLGDRDDAVGKSVSAVMVPVTEDALIAPNEDAAAALMQMQRTGKSRLLVAKRHNGSQIELVGILSLRDLMNFLALKSDLDRR
ncbi:site-2 protease family protein [Fodinicurvata sp. EGI_FJ10296]|uniref:site-2 protease family protein n=1 Tax=Fodinicurvata sp. EGI_FJ10296 TaxID=3231908 RepID=UPI003453FD2C